MDKNQFEKQIIGVRDRIWFKMWFNLIYFFHISQACVSDKISYTC